MFKALSAALLILAGCGDDDTSVLPQLDSGPPYVPVCGNGVLDSGEDCDDGDDNGVTCPLDCLQSCGDGITTGSEECDDANSDAYDGCLNCQARGGEPFTPELGSGCVGGWSAGLSDTFLQVCRGADLTLVRRSLAGEELEAWPYSLVADAMELYVRPSAIIESGEYIYVVANVRRNDTNGTPTRTRIHQFTYERTLNWEVDFPLSGFVELMPDGGVATGGRNAGDADGWAARVSSAGEVTWMLDLDHWPMSAAAVGEDTLVTTQFPPEIHMVTTDGSISFTEDVLSFNPDSLNAGATLALVLDGEVGSYVRTITQDTDVVDPPLITVQYVRWMGPDFGEPELLYEEQSMGVDYDDYPSPDMYRDGSGIYVGQFGLLSSATATDSWEVSYDGVVSSFSAKSGPVVCSLVSEEGVQRNACWLVQ